METIKETKHINTCDIRGCKNKAEYDGKTNFGCWANMCSKCFKIWGLGLGLGKGQKLAD